jgi:hypothetical protein
MKNLSLHEIAPDPVPPPKRFRLAVDLTEREMMALRNLVGAHRVGSISPLSGVLNRTAREVGHSDYLDTSRKDQGEWDRVFAHRYTHQD